jgi:hypothetical protein
VHERALEEAAYELDRRRRRCFQAGTLAGGSALAAGVAAMDSLPLAAALGAGAFLEALMAAVAASRRRELVARLALEPAAYALPAVAAYGARVAHASQRVRLAAWLVEVIADACMPHSLYLGDRVALVAQELEVLARELVSPTRSVEPTSAVACRRLLTHAVESPLYNPALPLEELRSTLRRIRAGIA